MTDKPMIDSEAVTAGAVRQSVEREAIVGVAQIRGLVQERNELARQFAQAQERERAALAREAELRRVVEAAIAARDAFRLYDNPEKWHKAIAKLARVVEDLDPKLVVALDREEGRE